jgi:hypothetical protein
LGSQSMVRRISTNWQRSSAYMIGACMNVPMAAPPRIVFE